MRTIVHTKGMEPLEWFDRTTQVFADLIPPMKLYSPDDWRTWAAAARRVQSQVPDPYQYDEWQAWGERFNLVMSQGAV